MGSTGKGICSAWLAHQVEQRGDQIDIATTAAGANSGHWTKRRDGSGYVAYHLPTSGIECKTSIAYSNAGSIVDIDVLGQEIIDCDIDPRRVVIDPRAAVITEAHKAAERETSASTSKIASTQHGVGAALADKIWRKSPLVQGVEHPSWMRVERLDLNRHLNSGASVVVECPQGFDLSIDFGLAYPFVTSRNCTVAASLSNANIHPSFCRDIAMTVRSFPIRVGHLYSEHGELIGTSGPFYDDSVELSWDTSFPHLAPELTSVTKRVRRISTFSYKQYERALSTNRPSIVMLTFADYLPSAIAFLGMVARMRKVEESLGMSVQRTFGFGPCIEDITDNIDAAASWYDDRSPTWS